MCLLLPLQSTTAIRARCGRSTVLSQPKKFADGAIIDYLFWKTTRYNQQSSLRLACQIATSRRRLPPSPRAAPVAAQHAAQRTECPIGKGPEISDCGRLQLHRLKASKLKSGVRKYACAPCLGGGAAGWVRGLGEKRERQNRSSVFIAFSVRASARRTHWPALWSSLVTFLVMRMLHRRNWKQVFSCEHVVSLATAGSAFFPVVVVVGHRRATATR